MVYASIRLDILQRRCDDLDFLAPISRRCMSAYRWARLRSISGIVGGLLSSWQGVVAGGSFATTFAWV
eukprot:5693550-Pyramimonas_sp.AAC.1